METIPCPTCGLPRAVSDAPSIPCPVCNRLATDPPPEATAAPTDAVLDPEPAPVPTAGSTTGSKWMLLAGTALVAATIAAFFLWWPNRDHPPTENTTPGITAERPPAPAGPEIAPAPRTASLAVALPTIEVAPLPRTSFLPAGPYAVIRLDRPDSDYRLDKLGEGNRLKLVGRVRRLMIEGIENGAALDASELVVRDIYFHGKLDGQATAVVRSNGGAVIFRGNVTGQSRLRILQGTDFVSFAAVPTSTGPGSQIDGGSFVQVAAKAVHFAAPITGPDTTVEVTLDRGGSIRFAMVDRAAKLLYRSVDPDGPPPRVHFGDVRGGAETRLVD